MESMKQRWGVISSREAVAKSCRAWASVRLAPHRKPSRIPPHLTDLPLGQSPPALPFHRNHGPPEQQAALTCDLSLGYSLECEAAGIAMDNVLHPYVSLTAPEHT